MEPQNAVWTGKLCCMVCLACSFLNKRILAYVRCCSIEIRSRIEEEGPHSEALNMALLPGLCMIVNKLLL